MSTIVASPAISPVLPSLAPQMSDEEIRRRVQNVFERVESIARVLMVSPPGMLEHRDRLVTLVHNVAERAQTNVEETVHNQLVQALTEKHGYDHMSLTFKLPLAILKSIGKEGANLPPSNFRLKDVADKVVSKPTTPASVPTLAPRAVKRVTMPTRKVAANSPSVVTLSSDEDERPCVPPLAPAPSRPATTVVRQRLVQTQRPPTGAHMMLLPAKRSRMNTSSTPRTLPPIFTVEARPIGQSPPLSYVLNWKLPPNVLRSTVVGFSLYYRRTTMANAEWSLMSSVSPDKHTLTINRVEAGRFELGLSYSLKSGQYSSRAVQPIRF